MGPTSIAEWAQRHGVSDAAVQELNEMIAPWSPAAGAKDATSESDTQAKLRVAAGRLGWPLWRNNNIAAVDASGRMIRAGLGNDSKRVSDKIKSSDLIGACPLLIQPHHVGTRVGVFTAVEVKHPKWTKPEKEADRAQERFLNCVRALGGFAGFATHESDLERILQHGTP